MNAIGQPISRIDGRLKVTGGAHYTSDIPIDGIVHGVIVQSTIANGRTTSIDTAAAEHAPGVLAVFTHRNMPRMNPTPKPWSHLHPHGQSYLPLQDDRILYADQPIALVVGTSRDQAAYAGTLIRVDYETEQPAVFRKRRTMRFNRHNSYGRSPRRSEMRMKRSLPAFFKLNKSTPHQIDTTTRWSRTPQRLSGTPMAC